jgi:8-oxo-dGTP pyrophosphatase MutT (NUDIX family)
VTTPERIRPLALGLVWRERDGTRELLVFEGYDRVKIETYYRPLGGGIEFGEHSAAALRREFREELGAELERIHYLATLENIFVCDGQPGHEIVLLYEATLSDPAFYARETMIVQEDIKTTVARWLPLTAFTPFTPHGPPLYPDGLLDLLVSAG